METLNWIKHANLVALEEKSEDGRGHEGRSIGQLWKYFSLGQSGGVTLLPLTATQREKLKISGTLVVINCSNMAATPMKTKQKHCSYGCPRPCSSQISISVLLVLLSAVWKAGSMSDALPGQIGMPADSE